jgi:hypothetical protein
MIDVIPLCFQQSVSSQITVSCARLYMVVLDGDLPDYLLIDGSTTG